MKPVEAGPAPGIVYADIGIRIGAAVIDALIVGIPYAIVQSIFWSILIWNMSGLWTIWPFLMAVLICIGSAVYFIYTWTRLRASLGQRFLGLETVSAANGATLTQAQAIRRWAFLFAPQAISIAFSYGGGGFGLGGLGLGMLISLAAAAYEVYLLYTVTQSGKRQGFHDVQAGTVVIKRLAA